MTTTSTFEGTTATWTGAVTVAEPPPNTDQRLFIVEECLAADQNTPSDDGFLTRVVYAAAVPT